MVGNGWRVDRGMYGGKWFGDGVNMLEVSGIVVSPCGLCCGGFGVYRCLWLVNLLIVLVGGG